MINQQLVVAIAGRSGASQAEVMAAFRESVAQDMANLRTAAASDRAQVALHAHRLRGASDMLGASGVADAARLLEESAGSGNGDRMHQALAALECEVQALDDFLRTTGAGEGEALP
jgi:HPt (histidine-containing phosphotransfer) domain-containing protein